MFKKLLKYDLKATKRYGLPITIGILVAGLLGALDIIVMSNLSELKETNFFATCGMIIGIILFMGVYLMLLAGPTIIPILIMVDFYKNLGSDEGYLTFTLPVKAKDIIWSKLVNCTIWSLITGVATLISVMFIVAGSIVVAGGTLSDFPTLGLDFGISQASIVWLYILIILFAIASFFNSILLYFNAIFLGTIIAKKNKGLSAVLSVVIVNSIYGTVTSIVFTAVT